MHDEENQEPCNARHGKREGRGDFGEGEGDNVVKHNTHEGGEDVECFVNVPLGCVAVAASHFSTGKEMREMKKSLIRTVLDKDGKPMIVHTERSCNADGRKKYDNPRNIWQLACELNCCSMAEEYAYCLYMDGAFHLQEMAELSHDTVCLSIISPRELYQKALLVGAVNVAVLHNHPSGNLSPSKEDENSTKLIRKLGELLGVHLVDHIIVSREGYFSFSENKLI